jgi:pimeloyl-ACP methyl ester carboxylesterase
MSLTYALIPGAGGSAWYWHRLVSELRSRGHDAIAVDLPAADENAGLAEYADAVVRAIGEPSGPIVLVAQSMGAFTAPLVAQRIPVSLLVFLNAMIPRLGETPGEWWAATGQSEAMRTNDQRDGRPPDADFDMRTYFFHDVPESITDMALATPQPQADKPFGDRLTIEAWPPVPTRVLIGRDDRFFPAEFQRRLAHERLGIDADEMPGGHLLALSYPTELANQLETYVAALSLAHV